MSVKVMVQLVCEWQKKNNGINTPIGRAPGEAGWCGSQQLRGKGMWPVATAFLLVLEGSAGFMKETVSSACSVMTATPHWKPALTYRHRARVCARSLQSCLTLCNPVDRSPPGSSVHGILQARIPAWVAILFSRGSCPPNDWTWVSCIAGRYFTFWATREAPKLCLFTMKPWSTTRILQLADNQNILTFQKWFKPSYTNSLHFLLLYLQMLFLEKDLCTQ